MIAISRLTGLDPRRAADLVILFGTTYAVERVMAEIYKTFFRDQDQSKYSIPMQFAVFGKVVKSRSARLRPAPCTPRSCWRMIAVVYAIDRGRTEPYPLPVILLVGGLGGWISAVRRGLEGRALRGLPDLQVLSQPAHRLAVRARRCRSSTTSLVLIGLAATGFTVATTETYKTFFFPSKPRGKFAGTPVHFPDMMLRRQRYIALYVAIWLVVVGGDGEGPDGYGVSGEE